VTQIIHDGKKRVHALNVELRFELSLGKKIRADASHTHTREFRE
jgi:hypothetical protein